ncbi:hypothetical protein ANCCEY_12328 [Ancylostoma ceylanicum]|uniref:Peptidase A1 domain-containing protein n=1 Tax=Ancylostoma ceylanicum TaxID=53326 RepID=A0A0D6L9Y3_9BILA|nr:hypothetical protein ANCCEY_12328 [Ancylostoma ceylanicum]
MRGARSLPNIFIVGTGIFMTFPLSTSLRKRFAEGFDGRDTFRFGTEGEDRLMTPRYFIGQAEKVDPCLAQMPFDGVVGLGFVIASPVLLASRMGLLDQPIFTVFLKQTRKN